MASPVQISPASSRSWLRRLIPALLLGLIIFISKLVLVYEYGGEIPFNDEWDAYAAGIFSPALDGTLTWSEFFQPNNEHRILPTKLLAYAGFKMAGNVWDVRLQQVASLLVQAAVFAVLGAWLGHGWSRSRTPWVWLSLGVVGFLPLAYQNTLWSFQNQFYFLILFTLLAGWGLQADGPRRWRWWLGVLAGAMAVLSMGSGGLAGAALVVLVLGKWINRRQWSRDDAFTGLVGLMLVVAMLLLRTTVERHGAMAAHHFWIFSLADWRLMSWPWSDFWLAAPVFWLPWFALVGLLLSRRMAWQPRAGAILFLGSWALLQMVALAWARGSGLVLAEPESRYQDILALGVLVNLLAGLLLWDEFPQGPRSGRMFFLLWAALQCGGLAVVSWKVARVHLPVWAHATEVQAHRSSWYLATGNESWIAGREPWEVGHNNPQVLLGRLRDPAIHRVLPPALGTNACVNLKFFAESGLNEEDAPLQPMPLLAYPTWGNWSARQGGGHRARMLSEPVQIDQPHLQFDLLTSGSVAGISINFIDASGVKIPVSLPGEAGETWSRVRATVSPGLYRLEVLDERPAGWLALNAPRQLSALSHGLQRGRRVASGLLVVTVILVAAWLAQAWFVPRRKTGINAAAPDFA